MIGISFKYKRPDVIPTGQFSDVHFKDNVYGASMIAEGARIPPGMGKERAAFKVSSEVQSVHRVPEGLHITGPGLDVAAIGHKVSLSGQAARGATSRTVRRSK